VIVGIIRQKPVFTHASIVCEGMLASVNSVKKIICHNSEIWRLINGLIAYSEPLIVGLTAVAQKLFRLLWLLPYGGPSLVPRELLFFYLGNRDPDFESRDPEFVSRDPDFLTSGSRVTKSGSRDKKNRLWRPVSMCRLKQCTAFL